MPKTKVTTKVFTVSLRNVLVTDNSVVVEIKGATPYKPPTNTRRQRAVDAETSDETDNEVASDMDSDHSDALSLLPSED